MITNELCRMEHSRTSLFDDRFTLAVIDRTPPVHALPIEVAILAMNDTSIVIQTGAIKVTYTDSSDGFDQNNIQACLRGK